MKIHGHTTKSSQSRTYTTYQNMLGRCHRVSHDKYPKYGAVGITVCERWRESFANFLADMGERPEGKTIDRIDGKLGYFKENCKWSSPKEQQRNLANNVYVTFKGATKLVGEWSAELGIPTLAWRIRKGWPVEKAFSTEPKLGNRTIKTGQVLHTYKGKTQCLSEWAREYKMSIALLRLRLSKGWDFERCLTTPKGVFVRKAGHPVNA